MSVSCSLVVTCWKRTDLLALLYVMFSHAFTIFPYGVLVQVWYLIPDISLSLTLQPLDVGADNYAFTIFLSANVARH